VTLYVAYDRQRLTLDPGGEATFGRDPSCTVRLDPADPGVSRLAGKLAYRGGLWWIANLSRKRLLHVVDGNGFTIPLPIAVDGLPSRRAVDQNRMTVLVPGERWTYEIRLHLAVPVVETGPPPPAGDLASTRAHEPVLTDRRREVIVALAEGYLRPMPHYDPRPRTYQEVADRLRLTRTQVKKRIEQVRGQLVRLGVPGLENEVDARRPLCEWFLAMRLVDPTDLAWLEARILALPDRRAAAGEDDEPAARDDDEPAARDDDEPAARRLDEPTDTARRVELVIEDAVAQVAPVIEQRLAKAYGVTWLEAVNRERRRRDLPAGRRLRDFRFCLALVVHEPAMDGWLGGHERALARELKRLGDNAAHRHTMRPDDLNRARDMAARFVRAVRAAG
jgi:hypothetical protein